jgi:hypothetical protein
VVHGRGRGHRAGVEGLHLIGAEAIFFQPVVELLIFIASFGVKRRGLPFTM